MRGLPFWPELASSSGGEIDRLFIALLVVAGLVLALVFGLVLVFAVRYRRGSRADRRGQLEKSWRWEVSWTAATFVAFLALFYWGADLYQRLLRPPDDATQVFVLGKQWMWQIQHEGGQRELGELHVPL